MKLADCVDCNCVKNISVSTQIAGETNFPELTSSTVTYYIWNVTLNQWDIMNIYNLIVSTPSAVTDINFTPLTFNLCANGCDYIDANNYVSIISEADNQFLPLEFAVNCFELSVSSCCPGATGPTGAAGVPGVPGATGLSGNNNAGQYVSLSKVGSQNYPSGSYIPVVGWGTEMNTTPTVFSVDEDNGTIRILEPGRYLVTGQIQWQSNSTGNREMRIRYGVVDETDQFIAIDTRFAPTNISETYQGVSRVINVTQEQADNSNFNLQMFARQYSGSNLVVRNDGLTLLEVTRIS